MKFMLSIVRSTSRTNPFRPYRAAQATGSRSALPWNRRGSSNTHVSRRVISRFCCSGFVIWNCLITSSIADFSTWPSNLPRSRMSVISQVCIFFADFFAAISYLTSCVAHPGQMLAWGRIGSKRLHARQARSHGVVSARAVCLSIVFLR
jgi:hypothetical protein